MYSLVLCASLQLLLGTPPNLVSSVDVIIMIIVTIFPLFLILNKVGRCAVYLADHTLRTFFSQFCLCPLIAGLTEGCFTSHDSASDHPASLMKGLVLQIQLKKPREAFSLDFFSLPVGFLPLQFHHGGKTHP